MRRSGDQVRITAQLINAANGYQLWSQVYDGSMSDVLEVQSQIAERIADALRVQLGGNARKTDDPEALDLLLKARYKFRTRTAAELVEARRLAEQAVAKDPDYADGWSTLASVLGVLPEYTPATNAELDPLAERAARRAIELDDGAGEPYAVLAGLREHQLDLAEADRQYRKAVELEPESATAHFWYSNFLRRFGYLHEAQAELQKAVEIEPTNAAQHSWLAVSALEVPDYATADAELNEAARLGDPRFLPFYRGMVRLDQGDIDAAVSEWQRYFAASKIETDAPRLMGAALRDRSRAPAALAAVAKLPAEEFGTTHTCCWTISTAPLRSSIAATGAPTFSTTLSGGRAALTCVRARSSRSS